MLAIARGVEQTIDELVISLRAFVGEESIDFLRVGLTLSADLEALGCFAVTSAVSREG